MARSISLTDRSVPRGLREQVLGTVCARFATVLGPGSDWYHEDHIHLDLAPRRGGYKICQWNVWDPLPQVAPLLPAERPEEAPPREVAEGSAKPGSAAQPAAAPPAQASPEAEPATEAEPGEPEAAEPPPAPNPRQQKSAGNTGAFSVSHLTLVMAALVAAIHALSVAEVQKRGWPGQARP